MVRYQFLSPVILRTPFYSYQDYAIGGLGKRLYDHYFQLAIFLANPQLYDLLKRKQSDIGLLSDRERLSILRYFNRMSFRPTPFGSFASFTIMQWGQHHSIRFKNEKSTRLHLNFDQEVAFALSDILSGNDTEKQTYRGNPTLYKTVNEFRYIKTNYTPDKKRILFAIESYEYNQITKALFAFFQHATKTGNEIARYVTELTGSSHESAVAYLNFLIEAQIIIPQSAMNIIGEDFTKIRFKEQLPTVYQKIRSGQLLSNIDRLANTAKKVNALQGPNKFSQVFYSGLERRVDMGSLSNRYQDQIMEGLIALQHLVQSVQPQGLKQFIHEFKSRYDLRKIPLLVALDPEVGIGYGKLTNPDIPSELLKKINFKTAVSIQNEALNWSATHQFLLRKWNQNIRSTDSIQISDVDLEAIPMGNSLSPPPSLPVMFRIWDNQVYLETVGGVTATALIGRFNIWSEEVHALGKEIAAREQTANPNVIFAELGQISDTHADNINRRNHVYSYEIPINSVSTLPIEKQIALSDLLISVVSEEIVLESASLRKVIVPRLSSAYNYNRNSLAIFRFLCDLQHQGLQSNYTFDLEHYFPGMDHYPRVVFKQTILSPAKWYLDVKGLESTASFALVRKEKGLPVHIALTKFDQHLVFNMNCEEDMLFLLKCIKGMDRVMVQEFFIPDSSIVTTHDGKPLISQFITFLYHENAVYSGSLPTRGLLIKKVKQAYIIGSRWLYLKLYCNPSITNELLTKKLLPLLKQFAPTELNSWFFVRYRDEGYHIRLRLKVREDFTGTLLMRLKNRLEDKVRVHLIREYQADTYHRELERYGVDIMDLVEELFNASSELIIRYIKLSGQKTAKYSYHSIAFVSVAHLLDSFLPSIHEQIAFLNQMVHTFYSEFSKDKSLKVDLDLKYRELKTEITVLLNDNAYYEKQKLGSWSDLFTTKIKQILKPAMTFSHKRKTQLLADLIHMHLNRLFVDQQRKQELIVYYCLHKHQLSAKAIADKSRS